MELTVLTEKELKKHLNKTIRRIDETKLYFELKKRKLLRGQQSLAVIKAIIALTKLHLPITSHSVQWVLNNKTVQLGTLHNLGDKNLLVWKRAYRVGRGQPFEWMPSPYLADLIAYVWKDE